MTFDGGSTQTKSSTLTEEQGLLIILKTTIPKDTMSPNVHAYKLAHDSFPDESTADQFFDEQQFEAYRDLGYENMFKLLVDENLAKRLRPAGFDLSAFDPKFKKPTRVKTKKKPGKNNKLNDQIHKMLGDLFNVLCTKNLKTSNHGLNVARIL